MNVSALTQNYRLLPRSMRLLVILLPIKSAIYASLAFSANEIDDLSIAIATYSIVLLFVVLRNVPGIRLIAFFGFFCELIFRASRLWALVSILQFEGQLMDPAIIPFIILQSIFAWASFIAIWVLVFFAVFRARPAQVES